MDYIERELFEEEDTIVLSDLFKAVWKKKFLALGITAAITVIGTAGFWVYNRSARSYSASFTYNIPNFNQYTTEAKPTYLNSIFPDGSTFRYQELTSKNRLESVKKSDTSFSSIDTEEMYEKNGISVSFNSESVTYTLSAKRSYFANEDQAKAFISALASYPVEKVGTIMTGATYDTNLSIFSAVKTYDDKLDALNAQKALLVNGYNNLIKTYRESFAVNGKTLNAYQNEINVYFKANSIDTLYSELHNNGYAMDIDSTMRIYQAQIADLRLEQTYNERTILALKVELADLISSSYSSSLMQDSEAFNARIASLVARNVEIDRQIEIINGYLNDSEEKAEKTKIFDAQVSEIYHFLAKETDQYASVMNTVYAESATVDYTTNSVITVEGGINTALTIVGSGFVGVVVAACTNLFLCYPAVAEESKIQRIKKKQQLLKQLKEEE